METEIWQLIGVAVCLLFIACLNESFAIFCGFILFCVIWGGLTQAAAAYTLILLFGGANPGGFVLLWFLYGIGPLIGLGMWMSRNDKPSDGSDSA